MTHAGVTQATQASQRISKTKEVLLCCVLSPPDAIGVLITGFFHEGPPPSIVTLTVYNFKDFVHFVVRGGRGGEELRREEHPGAWPCDDQTNATQTARNEQLQLATRW